jgi:cytochrome P450
VLHLPTANRDPDVFAAPDVFDIDRPAAAHLGFGHGAHRCIGAGLALAQAEAAVRTLFERHPQVRLAPGTAPTVRTSDLVLSLDRLMVTLC